MTQEAGQGVTHWGEVKGPERAKLRVSSEKRREKMCQGSLDERTKSNLFEGLGSRVEAGSIYFDGEAWDNLEISTWENAGHGFVFEMAIRPPWDDI